MQHISAAAAKESLSRSVSGIHGEHTDHACHSSLCWSAGIGAQVNHLQRTAGLDISLMQSANQVPQCTYTYRPSCPCHDLPQIGASSVVQLVIKSLQAAGWQIAGKLCCCDRSSSLTINTLFASMVVSLPCLSVIRHVCHATL
jgi:hypothetical protein